MGRVSCLLAPLVIWCLLSFHLLISIKICYFFLFLNLEIKDGSIPTETGSLVLIRNQNDSTIPVLTGT